MKNFKSYLSIHYEHIQINIPFIFEMIDALYKFCQNMEQHVNVRFSPWCFSSYTMIRSW